MTLASARWLGLLAAGCVVGCGSTAEPPSRPPPDAPAQRPAPATIPATAEAEPSPPKAMSLDELLLFFPSKYPDGDWRPAGLVVEDAWFKAQDGTRLHGWYGPCEKARAVVLFAHGNAGNVSHRAARMRHLQKELRVAALVFDYRGYGRSEGIPTAEGILQDARAARKWLAERAGVGEARIVLLGESLGGAVVADLAGTDGARALILESTFASLAEVARHHYPDLAWLVPADKLNSAARIARYAGPLLQCHGDADRTIPYASGVKLFEAAPGAKRFVRIAGGDHNDPPSADYLRHLERFLAELPDR